MLPRKEALKGIPRLPQAPAQPQPARVAFSGGFLALGFTNGFWISGLGLLKLEIWGLGLCFFGDLGFWALFFWRFGVLGFVFLEI